MKPEHLFISQTLLKNIIDKFQEEKTWCPLNIYEVEIHRRHSRFVTWPMKLGLYGETLCIGSGAREAVFDLPPDRRTGKKKISQLMVEHQAALFPRMATERQLAVHIGINTQVTLYHPLDEYHTLKGTLDIFPTPIAWNNEMHLAIVDVKFTKSIETTYGDYCWGTPEYIDHLQADMYHYLVRVADPEVLSRFNPDHREVYHNIFTPFVMSNRENIKFIYWIMGYGTVEDPTRENMRKNVMLLERAYRDPHGGNLRQMDLQERIRKGIMFLRDAEAEGWPARPHMDSCKKCPLARHNGGDCKHSIEDYHV